MIGTYFPTVDETKVKQDTDIKERVNTSLYIRAMPVDMQESLRKSGERAHAMYEQAETSRA